MKEISASSWFTDNKNNNELNKLRPEIISGLLVIEDNVKNDLTYNGSEDKFGVTINDVNYLVKQQKKDYSNVTGEYIASNFIMNCGVYGHETELCIYKDKLAVLCKDFTQADGKLKTFSSINSSSFDTDVSKYDYFFTDVLYELERLKRIDLNSSLSRFWYMYLMDAILGNPDRHGGNWGVCLKNNIYAFSKIFDNGASLFPRATDYNITEEWMKERVLTFPNSKIMFTERERSSYLEVISSGVVPPVILNYVAGLDYMLHIDRATIGFKDEWKRFYKTIVTYRFNTIIKREPFVWRGMIE